MKKAFLFFLCWLTVAAVKSQDSLRIKWDKMFSPPFRGIEHCLIAENGEEELIVLGQTFKDLVYFASVNKEGKLLRENSFSFPKAIIKAIRSLGDNRFLLVGSIKREQKNFPALWEWRAGDVPQLIPFEFSNQPGIFNDISDRGRIFLTGAIGGKMFLAHLNNQLQLEDRIFRYDTVASSTGNSIALNDFGGIYIVGSIEEEEQSRFQIWKFNSLGIYVRDFTLDAPDDAQGIDLCVLDNQDVIALGLVKNTTYNNQNLYLTKLRPSFTQDTSRIYTSPDQSLPYSIIQTPSRRLLVAGQHTLFNARTGDLWLQWLDRENGDVLSQHLQGSGKMDKASQAVKLLYGDYVVAGIVHEGQPKIRLFYFKGVDTPCDNQLDANKEADFFPLQSSRFVLGKKSFNYNGYILSKSPLSQADVVIRRTDDAAKAPGFLKLTGPLPTKVEDQYCYFSQKRLGIKEGANTIQVRIGTGASSFVQENEVFVISERPRLFVLSVGVPYNDLNYTDEDAYDFTRIFREQEGMLYDRVDAVLINKEEETTAIKISEAFQNLRKAHQQGVIRPKDVLLVFFSAHGEVIRDRFYIPGSDRDLENLRTLVDYEREVKEILENIDCKKLVFLDACRSGAAKSGQKEIASAAPFIQQITNAAPGTVTFRSSSDDQLSYEQDSLQNGLFTEALIKAFEQTPEEADTDGNAILTIGELEAFLKKEVPAMIDRLFAGTGREQTPGKSENSNLPDDFPFFYIRK